MRKLNKDERGFTLIEMVVVIVLIGLITGGITAAIMQVLTINTRASNHMIAIRQVQQAGKEVSKDALQAQSINATISPDVLLILTWDEWGTNQTNTVNYTLENMSGGLKRLQRSHTFNDTVQTTAPPVVAEYIDDTIDPVTGEPKTNCDWDGSVLTFTVTATVGTESETRIYEIEPRPD